MPTFVPVTTGMKLIIDIGNTRIKAALFEQKQLKHLFVFDSVESFLQSGIAERCEVTHAILGSVVNELEPVISAFKKHVDLLLFESNTPIPLKNLYKTAATLGSDRLAAAIGANAQEPNRDVLVVDAGTCIKYNFVNAQNEYLGGGISPGLRMRLKAMHTFTARLPLLDVDAAFENLIGSTTEESLFSGAELGALAEVEGFISQYSSRFNNLKVFLTGGDTEFFEKRLKNRIFADQNLILKGLNEVLDYNISRKEQKN